MNVYYLVGLPHILVYLLYRNRIKEIKEDLARFLPPPMNPMWECLLVHWARKSTVAFFINVFLLLAGIS